MRRMLPGLLLVCSLLPASHATADTQTYTDGDVYATVGPGQIVLGNSLVERIWDRTYPLGVRTASIRDKRTGLATHGFGAELEVNGLGVSAPVSDVSVRTLPRGGLHLEMTWFQITPPAIVIRTVEAYPGVAGFAVSSTLYPLAPAPVATYALDQLDSVGIARLHAFRAGADWRGPDDWRPQFALGDAHTGDWRQTTEGFVGSGAGQWLSAEASGGARLFLVAERNDYASNRMFWGPWMSAYVDYTRDLVYTGPFEEDVHAENPTPLPTGRARVLTGPTDLGRVFTGFGTDADDEAWQFFSYLTKHRLTPYKKALTFNTNNVDEGRISTGAKDDVDFTRFMSLAQAAEDMGVETFIFDDGWQAASGDWCPDSADCPEPRAPKYPPRFPDDHFGAVRQELGGIDLGLWMTPMAFHPRSHAFQDHPEWGCAPVGHATAAYVLADPDSGSNEAGIGLWGPLAIPHVESRIRRAITDYGARYFKFDFLVWVDCAGNDFYAYHDAFVAMLDRLQADHPEVTFEIDETNDYRLFPFESVARGPSWFQNGGPETKELLHNVWDLSPYVPAFSLGQGVLNSRDHAQRTIDYMMAVALTSHITFWSEIDELTAAQRAQVRRWTDFYKANRDELTSIVYPLLDDPRGGGWAALQPWDPEAGRGFLLAYRQGDAAATKTIPFRAVPAGRHFQLTRIDPATGAATDLGVTTSADLTGGITVDADPYGYEIVHIVPA
jgi:hypothetical protein